MRKNPVIKSSSTKLLLIGVFAGVLAFTTISSLWNSVMLNKGFVELTRMLPPGSSLSEAFVPAGAVECPPEEVVKPVFQILSIPLVGNELFWGKESCKTPLSTLAAIHRARDRDELYDLFTALLQVRAGDDGAAITTLLTHQAYGALLGIATLLSSAAKPDRKARYLEAAFSLQPHDYPIINQLARHYLAQGNYCDLVSISRAGVAHYPSSPLFYYYLGRAYEGLGAWQQAGEAYQGALERFPNYEPYERRLRYSEQQARTNPALDSASICVQDQHRPEDH